MSVASADEKSLSIFQYITRDYPFGSDDVCSVSAFAAAIAPGRIILEQIRFVRNRLWRSDQGSRILIQLYWFRPDLTFPLERSEGYRF